MSLANKAKKKLAWLLYKGGFLAIARWLRVTVLKRPRLTILCYHRITEKALLLSPQCITLSEFEKQLAFFKKHYQIGSLEDVDDYLKGHRTLQRDVIVFTFDDGYDDNYTNAHHALSKANITATFFISAAPLLNQTPYWIDRLGHILTCLEKQADDNYPLLQENLKRLLIDFVKQPAEGKRPAAKAIFLYLNSLPETEKQTTLTNLSAWLKLPEPAKQQPDTAIMSLEQALALQQAGHTIAAHSMTHPKFANLDEPALCEEISQSIQLFRENGFSVRYFAYPFGKMSDIGEKLAIIKETFIFQQIALAFTTEDGVVPKSVDRYLVPRKVMSPQSIPQINLKLETIAWTTHLIKA